MAQAATEQRIDASSKIDQEESHEGPHQATHDIGTPSFARFSGFVQRTLELKGADDKKSQDSPRRHQLPLIGETRLADLRGLMSQAQHAFHGPPEERRPAPQIT
jgi:hypothetical protein